MNFFSKTSKHLPEILLLTFVVVWALLAIDPARRDIWALENLLVFVLLPVIFFSFRKFRLSNLSYCFIFAFGIFHIIGAHFTYANTPIGEWLSPLLGEERNSYDRVVHFFYGISGVVVMFDILRNYLPRNRFVRALFVFSVVLSFGALYEILEYLVSVVVGSATVEEFLAFQGDAWDTQKDLFLEAGGAFIGIITNRVFKRR